MIHKACMPVYIVIQIFLAHGWTDIQPEVVQEVLADLKSVNSLFIFTLAFFLKVLFPFDYSLLCCLGCCGVVIMPYLLQKHFQRFQNGPQSAF